MKLIKGRTLYLKADSLSAKRGFTLIELLVVVAIIGVLASVVLSSLGDARTKAQNVAKIQNVRQIQTALTLYFDDNGHYPIAGASCLGDYGTSDTCNVRITTSTSPASGNANVQAMVQQYIGGNPEHYSVTNSSGYTQDSFYYLCRNGGCTEYFMTYILDGVDQNCGRLRGLNSSSFVLASTENNTTADLGGTTYCMLVVDRETPADYL